MAMRTLSWAFCHFLLLNLAIVQAENALLNNEWQQDTIHSATERHDYTFTVNQVGSVTIVVEPCSGCADVTLTKGTLMHQFNSEQDNLVDLEKPGIGKSLRKGFFSFSSTDAGTGTYAITVRLYRACRGSLKYRIIASTNIAATGRPVLPPDDEVRIVNTTLSAVEINWNRVLSPPTSHYCVYTVEASTVRMTSPDFAIGSACAITSTRSIERQAGCTADTAFTVRRNLATGRNYVVEVLAYGLDDDKSVAYRAVQTAGIFSAGLTVSVSCFLVSIAVSAAWTVLYFNY